MYLDTNDGTFEICADEERIAVILDLTRRIHLLEELMMGARARRQSDVGDIAWQAV